jgi:hypothetical protein
MAAAGMLPKAGSVCENCLNMVCSLLAHRRPRALGFAVLVPLVLSGCVAPAAAPGTSQPEPIVVSAPPEWRPGDQWVYTWTSGSTSGTKTMEVLETREINTVSFYLVGVGGMEQFYTRDLQWAGSMRDGKVQARMIPPQPWFIWPLEMGRHWTHRGTYEDPSGKRPQNDSFSVAGTEVVEVPAGQFRTLKVVRETNSRDADQYWYASEVGFYVKWIGRRGDAQFEEQLREYHRAPRLTPGPAPSVPPSNTK